MHLSIKLPSKNLLRVYLNCPLGPAHKFIIYTIMQMFKAGKDIFSYKIMPSHKIMQNHVFFHLTLLSVLLS